MFLINFLSSYLFLIPMLFSYYRNDFPIFYGSTAVLLTSIIYHGTLNPIARRIDMFVSSFCIAYFMFTRAAFTIWYGIATLCLIYILIIWNKNNYSREPDAIKQHSLIHVLSCLGICCVIN